jgi:hypothetical protein
MSSDNAWDWKKVEITPPPEGVYVLFYGSSHSKWEAHNPTISGIYLDSFYHYIGARYIDQYIMNGQPMYHPPEFWTHLIKP